VVVGGALEKIYDFFFLERDIRISKEEESRFAREIEQELHFLFVESSSRFIALETIQPDLPKWLQHPRWPVVVLATNGLLFRFYRGRGELGAWVAPKDGHQMDWSDFGDLEIVLAKLGWREGLGPRPFSSLADLAAALEPRMAQINSAFSKEEYPAMQKFLLQVKVAKEEGARLASIKLNKRLYG
jgi:hypothetical protein